MTMPETFDPRGFGGGPACVQGLRADYDIRVSQRLGARLVAMARRGVQFSLALLEAASPGSELERVLLDESWANEPQRAAELIGSWGRAVVEADAIKVVAADEVDDAEDASPRPPVALAIRPSSAAPAPLPAEAWTDARLEAAARTVFDAEDPAELVEKLRMLFRAAVQARLDPLPLLLAALQRGKKALSAEVGALVRQHLDRDSGRALEDLAGDDEGRIRDAIHFLMRTAADSPLAVLVLPAITPAASGLSGLRHILGMLVHVIPLVHDDPDVIEPFLDGMLDPLTELEAPERFTLSRFLIRIQDRYPALPAYLFRRLRATVDTQVQAFYGNVMARMTLDDEARERLTVALVELFQQHGNDVALAERLKVTFLYLGQRPLELLTEEGQRMGSLLQRSYLVDLWTTYLNNGSPTPPLPRLAEFLAGEMAARNRAALLSMIRSSGVTAGKVDLLALPALVDYVRDNDWVRGPLIAVLLEEAVHLEDPDDLAVMDFLCRLGRDAVEAAFERSREEAALDSRAAPYRFRIFAYLAAHMASAPWLSELTEVALSWPFLRRHDLPVTLTGLGLLSRVPGVSEAHLFEILDALLPPDAADVRFAAARVHAVLDMYAGTTCPPAVRERIEARLEGIITAEAPARDLLVAALDGLDALTEREAAPLRVDAIAVALARMVLKKSRETSLENVLSDMLRDETEGHGVRVPEAWSKEERDHALIILGKVACHPEVGENLHRMVTARLSAFLEDWLDAHERGDNLYMHRDTPLCRVLTEVVERRPTEYSIEAVVRVGLRALEVQRKAPANLALERREELQRLLAESIWLAPQEPIEVRGSMALDIPKAALQTLINVASRDNDNAQRVLADIVERVPPRLRPQIDAFLSFQRRRTGT